MRIRRLISVFLVVAMLFSVSVSAFAAGSKIKDDIINEATFVARDYAESKTLYITVNVEDYPELSGLSMLNNVAVELYEKQADYDDGTYVLMSKQHIAGELAIHVFLFKIFYTFGGDKEDSMFHDNYNSAKIAELNIDEARFSSGLIDLVGGFVLAFGAISASNSSSDGLLSSDDLLSTDDLLSSDLLM